MTTYFQERNINWWLIAWIASSLSYVVIFTYNFNNIALWIIKQVGATSKMEKYDDQRQTKIRLNTAKASHFFIAFMATFIGICVLLSYHTLDFFGEELPPSLEIPFKIACVSLGTQFITDLYHGRKYARIDIWMHHIVSLSIIVLVFDVEFHPSFMLRRWYIYAGGCLLGSRFWVFLASLYYYLGDENQKTLRLILYSLGILTHVLFIMVQLGMGIVYKVHTNWIHEWPRVVCWFIVEIGVLPTQVIVMYDLYCIVRYKILSNEQRYHIQQNLSETEITSDDAVGDDDN